jgi:H+/gluconate symporter-like permease
MVSPGLRRRRHDQPCRPERCSRGGRDTGHRSLTGSASGGLTIALDALGATYIQRAAEIRLNPALLHRVAVIGSGTLDSLPHNGAVVTLLAVCGSTHRESYRDIIIVGIVGPIIALAAIIILGSSIGSF